MSDDHLRQLLRRYQESKSGDDARAVLHAMVQQGELVRPERRNGDDPCPYCGFEIILHDINNGPKTWWVYCVSCGGMYKPNCAQEVLEILLKKEKQQEKQRGFTMGEVTLRAKPLGMQRSHHSHTDFSTTTTSKVWEMLCDIPILVLHAGNWDLTLKGKVSGSGEWRVWSSHTPDLMGGACLAGDDRDLDDSRRIYLAYEDSLQVQIRAFDPLRYENIQGISDVSV